MKDHLGYDSWDELYIDPKKLRDDPQLQAYERRTKAEKLGKIQVAIIAIVGTAVLGLIVRQVELSIRNGDFVPSETICHFSQTDQLQLADFNKNVVKLKDNYGDVLNVLREHNKNCLNKWARCKVDLEAMRNDN